MKARIERPSEHPREFETAPDHVVVYSDMINVVSTGTEVILSVYQTLPGYPDNTAAVKSLRRATVIVNPAHAAELAKILQKHSEAAEARRKTEEANASED